ncbi:unnamed protein product [Schistosoma rodhaini]|nr:unnamed protein product [Schistosoma rodhaini]
MISHVGCEPSGIPSMILDNDLFSSIFFGNPLDLFLRSQQSSNVRNSYKLQVFTLDLMSVTCCLKSTD